MKIHFILVFAILCSANGRAQDRFFTFVNGWMNNYSIELADGYLLMGLEGIGAPTQHKLVYNSIDSDGLITSQLDYVIPNVYTTSEFGHSSMTIEIQDDIFLSAGYYIDLTSPNDSLHAVIYRYNNATDVIDTLFSVSESNWTRSFGLEKIDSNSFLYLCSLENPGTFSSQTELYSMGLDNSVNWSYQISCGSGCKHFPEEVVKLNNGNIALMIMSYDSNFVSGHERMKTTLVLLDENGNHLWTRYPGDEDNYHINPGGIVEVDNEIVVTYSNPYFYDDTGEIQINYEATVFLERFGQNGDSLSTIDYQSVITDWEWNGDTQPGLLHDVTQTQMLTDGGLLISGSTSKYGMLIKTQASGQVEWFNYYSPHAPPINDDAWDNTEIKHVLHTSDGGFLCTGIYDSSPSDLYPSGIQTAIALKLDEFGCLIENCTVGIDEYAFKMLEIWPNPTSNSATLRLPDDIRTTDIIRIELISPEGRRISVSSFGNSDQIQFPLSDKASGIYTLLLVSTSGVYSAKIQKI